MITLNTTDTPYKVIALENCDVRYYEHFVWTQFWDGSG